MNPVSLVRWHYLDWYSGWQDYNEAAVVFYLRLRNTLISDKLVKL